VRPWPTANDKGDRVKIVLTGKYLKYSKY